MEESMHQNPDALETLISRIFQNISSLKSAYIQLQAAHTPYDPDKIQAADKLVISELKNLSELKHYYRENNPRPVSVSPQDSRLAAEIQEQQSLLKTYENKDSEIHQMQQQIEEANQKRSKLEKNLKLRGLSTKGSEAGSIEPSVIYARRAHKKYAFESHICQKMFSGFQQENFAINVDDITVSKESFFHQYLALKEMDPLDAVGQNPDSIFGRFCRSKYLMVVHPKIGHPRTAFYLVFLKLAKSIWLLHRLAYSFDPNVKVFQVKRGSEFTEPKVGLMVMPGFWVGGSVIQSRVYLTGMKVAE
ncbi:Protein GRAVITROPIC IN THE LIGHT 1 [Linum perenne]